MKIKLEQIKRSLALVIAGVMAAAIVSFICVSAGRANGRVPVSGDFEVGDQVEASVSGLEAENAYEPCVVTEVLGNGYRLNCSGKEWVVQKAWVRRPQKAVKPPPPVAPPPPAANDDDGEPAAPANDDDGAPAAQANDDDGEPAAAADCDFAPPGPETAGTDRFSAAVAKREIYDNYKIGVRNGGTTSPLNIGVTFLTLEVGGSFRNIATAGYRINDAAPVNATIYHVRSKHIVCEQYRDSTLRRQVESGYSCFKNRDNEWACGIDGVPKITQLN